MPEKGKTHPIAYVVRGYKVVGAEYVWDQDSPFITLRLTYRHPSSLDLRRLEFQIPVKQEPAPTSAFPFLMNQLFFMDHSDSQWEGREIEIRFRGDYPWPIYADTVREIT